MDYTNDHLKRHLEVEFVSSSGLKYYKLTPRLHCADGYSVSIQAFDYAYCTPRKNAAVRYSHVELGYPSQHDPLLDEYCDDPSSPTDTIYPYVPIEVVNALIEKHGGPAIAKLEP